MEKNNKINTDEIVSNEISPTQVEEDDLLVKSRALGGFVGNMYETIYNKIDCKFSAKEYDYTKYYKSPFFYITVVVWIVSLICFCIWAFTGRSILLLISLCSLILSGLSVLRGLDIYKKKRYYYRLNFVVALVLLILGGFIAFKFPTKAKESATKTNSVTETKSVDVKEIPAPTKEIVTITKEAYTDLDWTKFELGKLCPEINPAKGIVNIANNEELSLTLSGVTKEKYNNFVDTCKELGWKFDSNHFSNTVFASDQANNSMAITYSSGNIMVLNISTKVFSQDSYTDSTEKVAEENVSEASSIDEDVAENGDVVAEVIEYDVPNLLDKSIDDAKKELANNNITNVDFVTDDGKPLESTSKYIVSKQSHKSGTKIADSDKMVVTVKKVIEEKSKEKTESDKKADKPKTAGNVIEYACKRDCGDYTIYYLFDEDTKTVYYLLDYETSALTGTYTGDTTKGFTITYTKNWKEKIEFFGGKVTLYDKDGLDWAFKRITGTEGDKIYNKIKSTYTAD